MILSEACDQLALYEPAIDGYLRLLAQGYESEEAYHDLSALCFRAGDFYGAEKAVAQGLSRYPRSPTLLYFAGFLKLCSKDRARAELCAEVLQKICPTTAKELCELIRTDNPELDRLEVAGAKREAAAHLEQADGFLQKGDQSAAAVALAEAVKKDPDGVEACTRLAQLLEECGLAEEAFVLHQEALRKRSRVPAAVNSTRSH